MSKYFTLDELCYSNVAQINKIDNTPSDEIKSNLILLMDFLDGFREYWTEYCKINNLGNPAIIITSGFRNSELNKIIGGVDTSNHLYGTACDLIAANGHLDELFNIILNNSDEYDELFFETSKSSKWIHFAYKNKDGLKRMKNGRLFV